MKLLKLVLLASLLISLNSAFHNSYADDDTCDPEPTDMKVNYGDYIFCSIAPVGDSDTYRIWVNEGDRLSIEVVDLDETSLCPQLLITAPNGDTLFDKSTYNAITCGANVSYDEVLTETGRYTIKISNHFNNLTGQYLLNIVCNGGSCLPEPSYQEGYIDGQASCEEEAVCPQVITYGQIPNANCWVMFPTPCDVPNGWESINEEPENMCVSSESVTTPVNPDSNCATFNLFTNTLNVPCLDMGDIYWVDMMLEGDHLSISGFGEVE